MRLIGTNTHFLGSGCAKRIQHRVVAGIAPAVSNARVSRRPSARSILSLRRITDNNRTERQEKTNVVEEEDLAAGAASQEFLGEVRALGVGPTRAKPSQTGSMDRWRTW